MAWIVEEGGAGSSILEAGDLEMFIMLFLLETSKGPVPPGERGQSLSCEILLTQVMNTFGSLRQEREVGSS